jgi:Tfp pilus assembly protein FimT
MKKTRNILQNSFAAEMIPIRMIISIGIIAGISVLLAFGYANMSITHAENQIRNDISALQSQLFIMIGTGTARDVDEMNAAEGTKRVQTFHLPESINYLAFGVDPDKDNTGILSTGHDQQGSVICFKVSKSSKNVMWLSQNQTRFVEGIFNTGTNSWDINNGPQGFIIDSPGTVTIAFELVQQNNEIYILIQATDNYEI